MAALLAIAAEAAGLDPSDVKSGAESAGVVGTGVEIHYRRDAAGPGRPGWTVTETFHALYVGSVSGGMVTETVGSFPVGDVLAAVRAAVMSIVQRRVEAALDSRT
jgi:hypothetical protein